MGRYNPEAKSFSEALTRLCDTMSGAKLQDTPHNRKVVDDAKFWVCTEMRQFVYDRRDLSSLVWSTITLFRLCNSIEWV